MLTLPKPLIKFIASFLKPSDYLSLRSTCKKICTLMLLNNFRLAINNESLLSSLQCKEKEEKEETETKHKKQPRFKYIFYTGNNYREHLAGCNIKKLRLKTSKINDFNPSTHFDFLELDFLFSAKQKEETPLSFAKQTKRWHIDGCKKIKLIDMMHIDSNAVKIYTKMHYYKAIFTPPSLFTINWLIPKKRHNLIIKADFTPIPENYKKIKIYELAIDISLLRTFSKAELYYTPFFRHMSIFKNITCLKLFSIIIPFDLPPQLKKLKLENIFSLEHLKSSSLHKEEILCNKDASIKNYIYELYNLEFLKVKNCDEALYFMKLPQKLRIYKIVMINPDIFTISKINSICTTARIILKKA